VYAAKNDPTICFYINIFAHLLLDNLKAVIVVAVGRGAAEFRSFYKLLSTCVPLYGTYKTVDD
jgi:hypothetical protein